MHRNESARMRFTQPCGRSNHSTHSHLKWFIVDTVGDVQLRHRLAGPHRVQVHVAPHVFQVDPEKS